jgi:hypothetical protein
VKDRMERARVRIPQKVAYRVRVDIADALARRGAPDAAPVPEEAARPSRRARSARITRKTHILGVLPTLTPLICSNQSVSSATLLLGPSSTSPSTPAPLPNTPACADVLS